jgi:F-type H+-transporting ATPase subunit b
MLDLNSSLLWIFFMVWGLYIVLTRIFFKPIGKIIDEREAKIAVDSKRLQGMVSQVEIHTQALENQMAQARKDALQIREEWSRKGEDVRALALSEAKDKAARIMDEKMNQLESEVSVAEKTLEKEIVVFSEKIKQAYL